MILQAFVHMNKKNKKLKVSKVRKHRSIWGSAPQIPAPLSPSSAHQQGL